MREQGEPVQLIGLQGGTTPLAEQLSAGELDVLLTLNTADSLQVFDRELVAIDTLAQDPLMVVAGHGLLADPGALRGWGDLSAYPWILPPRRTHVRQAVDAAFLQAGQMPPEPAVDAAQLYGCLRLAAQGLGITAMPQSALQASRLHDRLDLLTVDPPLPAMWMVVAYRRSAVGRRGLHAFIDSLRRLQAPP